MQLTDIYTPSSTVGGQNSTLTAKITNIGNGNADSFYVALLIDGQYVDDWVVYGLPAQNYTDFSVTLTGGLMAGTHSIQFVADYGNYVAESNEYNNNGTESFTWTGTPDLELTDVFPPSSTTGGQDSTLTARITNIGYANAGPFYVALYIDGGFVDEWLVSGGLPAQYYTDFSVTLTGGLMAGTHSIEFYADHYNSVAESNESNNYKTESFIWMGTPDLELTDVSPPSSTTGGQDSTLTARITNTGYADAGPFYVALYIDGDFVNDWVVSAGLPAQYYTDFSVTLTGGLMAGAHSIEFYADHYNSVAESNESNNYKTESFTWTGTPDLELTEVYPPSSTVGGQDSTLTARITNIGYADADSFYVALLINGQYVGDWPVYGLPAQYYTDFSITLTGGLLAGAHSIEFIADYGNYVAESDESNNSRTESFTWTGTPDLELTDIYVPTSLNEGADTTLSAQITNIGYADTGPFYIALVIDGSLVGSWQATGLPAWYYTEFGVTILGGLPAGSHSIQFVSDYYNDVTELNEANNNMTKNWTWNGPPPPSGVTAVPGPSSEEVTVSWARSSNPYISHYKIYIGTTSRNYSRIQDNVPPAWNSIPISNLTNDVTYYFAMTTVSTSGFESGFSNEVTASPAQIGDSTPPSAPSNLAAVNPGNGSELRLSWNPSTDDTGIDYYLVYRLTNGPAVSDYNYDSGFPRFVSSTTYADSGLSSANTYYYKVQAVDLSGNPGALSNLAYAAPSDHVAPSAPPTVGVSAENASVYLWWSMPTTNTDGSTLIDLAGFDVYRGTSSGSYSPTPINGSIPVTTTGFMDQGVTNGQTYYYVVRTVDDKGNEGPASFEVSGTPQGDVAPAPPANLSITEKETSLELAWNRNHESDVAGYNVYRGTSSNDHSTRMNGPLLTAEWFADTTASADQTYYYVVTAVDAAGHESGVSNEVSGTIGQGEVEIIAPTSSNPITIDFSAETMNIANALNPPAANIWNVANGIIRYKFTFMQRAFSNVFLEIKNSDTGEIVYTADEWNPLLIDPYFSWSGKYKSVDKCAPDGWYDAKVYVNVREIMGTYAETVNPKSIRITGCDGVRITDVYNPACANLAAPYACGDSFISNRARTGDEIRITASANRGAMDLSNEITWTCIDNPNDTIASGACSPSTGTGSSFSFIPQPPAAPTGRTGPLSYFVSARVNGIPLGSGRIITQDRLDELREEYEDLPERVSQNRDRFDQDAPAYAGLLGVSAEPERHQWHILRNLNGHAISANTSYSNANGDGINFTSGYRCPIGTSQLPNSTNTSNHQYGRAFDFNQGDSQDNYNGYVAVRAVGAADDTYLQGSNGIRYFWNRQYVVGVTGPLWPAPQGVTYIQGHAAWE